MALNPEKINFLLQSISNADHNIFQSVVSQLFNYLDKEVKDNPIYDKFQEEKGKWSNWFTDGSRRSWTIPSDLDEAKSFAFNLYRDIQENGDNLCFALYRQQKLSDNIYKFNNTFLGYLEQALDEIITANPEIEINKPKKTKGDLVFIVHGHDNELKREVQLLLLRAGVNNIVLHEQADKGRTIIDKLQEETENAGYAIALLTPDDLTKDGNTRARQNVILELGYFLGKIGKERVRMVTRGDIEIPSDLQGILYQKFDNDGAWKIKLLKELQEVGIYVDMNAAVNSF